MVAQEEENKTSSQIYWAGAFIAFGVSFLGLELLGFLNGVSPIDASLQSNIRIVIIILNIVGGFAGGYLVTMKSTFGWVQGGIVTGVMAIVLLFVFQGVLYGLGVIGDQLTMFVMLLGSVLGAFSYEHTDLRNIIKIGADKMVEPEPSDDPEKGDEEKES